METNKEADAFFVARQPIVDSRLELIGYELLFRGSGEADEPGTADGTTLTARVLIDGVLVNGLKALTGGVPAFVNFPASFLLGGAAAMLTPPDGFVLEILEDVRPTEKLLAALDELRRAGFRIALDDVVDAARVTAFAGCADLVKVDWPAATLSEIHAIATRARHLDMKLLAEKIETQDELDAARRLGFDYYQGYLLGRPASIRGRAMPGISAVHLRLLEVTSRPEIDLRELEEVVLSDPTLTYKVLSYSNSARAAQRRKIRTVRQALVLFGQEEIRRAAWIVAIAGVASQGPLYVLNETLARAFLCDAVAARHQGGPVAEAFPAGLMSGMDSILGISLVEATAHLPLPRDMQDAILTGRGSVGQAVTLASAYCGARWDEATARATTMGIPSADLAAMHRAASRRANELTRQFEQATGNAVA